ncbi:MAG: hypothetical protein KatS3mg128_0240 [Silanimonas sp.]|nr:MAG: hypothetical protein KatS3mg128_0240 [Silanimonas sp.]
MRHCLIATLALATAAAPALLNAQAGRATVRGEVPAAQAAEFIGREATVCGEVSSARFAETAEGQPTYLFIGGAFPNHPFSARIWGRDRDKFEVDLTSLAGKTVCVTGEIGRSNNRPEIVVRGARNLRVG